jgi:hypothetical protein
MAGRQGSTTPHHTGGGIVNIRCPGTSHPTCQHCLRRWPSGAREWTTGQWIKPPINTITGRCPELQAQRVFTSATTPRPPEIP